MGIHIAIYSALVLNKAIVGCFFADWDTTALQNMNVYLETDLQEFGSPAQSESVKLIKSSLSQFPW